MKNAREIRMLEFVGRRSTATFLYDVEFQRVTRIMDDAADEYHCKIIQLILGRRTFLFALRKRLIL